MRKMFLVVVAGLMGVTAAMAVPADQRPRTVAQPDGDSVTVRLVGDEYYHYHTTLDGYTVVRDASGAFSYARLDGGRLASTGVVAHNPERRNAAEQALLAGTDRYLTDRAALADGHSRRVKRDAANRRAELFNYDAFRGLVVLINYTDVKFTMNEVNTFYDNMCNEEGYTGFTYGTGWNKRFYECTGSMRDYYSDNSMGQFKPQFDVVGPVTVDYASTDQQSSQNSWAIFINALDKLDGEVDFSQYDTDDDGYIDMIYFIVAGYSANYGGNDSNLLWPHQSFLYDYDAADFPRYDGVYTYRYACSTEMYGWQNYHRQPLGIATMAHEFGHVLGLPDLYDTDYENGGQSHHPGDWDVMSGGDYNEGRTPVGYTIYERYSLGFANPTVITQPGTYTLRPVATSNEGYILPTPNKREFFMLDNRQLTGWDADLPGRGMMIARVDSTNSTVWYQNTVNALASRNYYELLRAGGSTSGASPSDPFPGSSDVTSVTNVTRANLLTWDGKFNDFEIVDIAEDRNGVITFTVREPEGYMSTIEDFETLPVTTATSSTDQVGRWAKWTFTNSNVQEPGEDLSDDARAVGMYAPSLMAMTTDVEGDIYRVSAHVINTLATTQAKFKLYYSTDQGETWNDAGTESVDGLADDTIYWSLQINDPVRFRLNMTGGSKTRTKRCYVDNFTLHHMGELRSWYDPSSEPVAGDVNGDGSVNATDVAIVINIIAGLESVADYPAADVTGDGVVNASDVAAVINIIAGIE